MTPEEVELLSELTIVIPTCNRPLELERAIEYWRDTPVTVHILDGSPTPCFEMGKIVSGNAKIYYHSVPTKPGEEAMENYARRLIEGIPFIRSKFAALLADDDFFTFRGLCTALNILSSNEKVDAVIGRCAVFYFDKNKIIWRKKYLNWAADDHLKDDSLAVRVKNDAGKHVIYYGILRSEKLREIHIRANKFVFSDFRVNELIAHHLGLAYCRTEVIEEYLWIRQRALLKNPNYRYTIRPSDATERLIVSKTFSDAISDIDPLVSEKLKSNWTMEKVNLIDGRLNADGVTYPTLVKVKRIKSLESVAKRVLVKFFLVTPKVFQSVSLKIVSARLVAAVNAERPPEFEGKGDLARLLLMPREELRLRANI